MQTHQEEFAAFKELHDAYEKDQASIQDRYNAEGAQIVEILREGERRLCGKMERGVHARYSAQLSEKYWDEVRAFFPLIDYVGVKWS